MYDLTKNGIDDTDEMINIATVKNDKVFTQDSEDFRRHLSKQLLDCVWTFGKDSLEIAQARIGALNAWEALGAQDVMEAMYMLHMVACSGGIMGNAHRAALEHLPLDVRERAQNQMCKQMDAFARHAAALDKHRGRGQQTIKVERVTVVEAGGQAITGNVQAPVLGAESSTGHPLPLPPTTVDLATVPPPRVRVRSRSRRSDH